MATSTITGTITDPTGAPLPNIKVAAVLRPRPAFVTATYEELSAVHTTTTDSNGDYALDLTETADITPAESYYEITEYIPDRYGGPVTHRIQVGAPNTTVLASLVASPQAPASPSYLTQAAGDARYVQSPGSFGASGDLAVSRPNDTAAGGALSTYARTDHRHDREISYGTAAERAALVGTDLFEGLTFRETDSTDKLYTYRNSAWLQAGDFVICTAATRPSNPYVGMKIYETDTGNELVYYGATTGWRQPWTQPWGFIAQASITSDSATATSAADVSGLSVSVPQVLNRRYLVTVKGELVCSVADGAAVWTITDGSNNQLDRWTHPGLSTSSFSGMFSYEETASATATVTRKVRQTKATGTGNVKVGASATSPAYILVQDIGPSGAVPSA